jgi:hypothetical protein
MTDTGVGFYLAIGLGAVAAGALAFVIFRAILFAIKFLLTKHKDGKR